MKITDLEDIKKSQKKISMLTCYDYPSAVTVSETDLDCVLVGDSVAMAVHGFSTTLHATMEMMVLHTEAVARGLQKQMLITDLPFLSHRISMADTMTNVRRLTVAGAQAIKIEGGDADTCTTISYLVQSGIAVVGHIGLTPQSIHKLGGYKIQGKQPAECERLTVEAKALERAGCSALVLECIPATLAATITEQLKIPTIGIGAGPSTDGQVLVWQDILGLQNTFQPRFVKPYTNCKLSMLDAINQYCAEVNSGQFPTIEHSY